MTKLSSHIAVCCLLAGMISASAFAGANEWTRFRGPNGTGISEASTIPIEFTEADYNWKVKLPGEGHGSAVVWGDKIFVMAADPVKSGKAQRRLVCLSTKDGSIQWTREFESNLYKMHKYNNNGATPPAVDDKQVYIHWASDKAMMLVALDHAGNEKWSINMGPFAGNHGGGTSPMVYKDMVVITNDQDGKALLLAVDKKSGKVRWKIDRKISNNGVSYGVPTVYEPKGQKPQLIFASKANGMTGVDPGTGKVIWEVEGIYHLRLVAGPIISGDVIVGSCGSGSSGKRFVAVQAGSSDGSKQAKELYRRESRIPYVSTPLVYKGLLYYVTDDGYATCMEPATGKVKWQEKGFPGKESFFASPVCVNGNIYITSKTGVVYVIKASPDKFQILGKSSLGELSYATPAVAGGRMYLRTLNHLISVGGK